MSDAPRGPGVVIAPVDRAPDDIAARPFALRWRGDSAELEGARWWNEAQRAWRLAHGSPAGGAGAARGSVDRRVWLTSIGGVVGGLILVNLVGRACDRDDPQVTMDALQLQQKMGWNAGQIGTRLPFASGLILRDVDDAPLLVDDMVTLWSALRPVQAALVPYYVPTLFRALAEERAGDLRAQMQLVHTDSMDAAFHRGQAIADLFAPADAPADVALIVDLPGPDAVALAAALSSRFEPVWLFDNWPHPLGVVASHRVLGAALYYRPLLLRNARAREGASAPPADGGTVPDSPAAAGQRAAAPPVFVLDSDRLAPYSDASDRFDNRYLARLPSAEALRGAGYRRILYVRPVGFTTSQLRELDDLNDDFVGYRDQGVDVRAMAMDDVRLDPSSGSTYYWGGSSHTHVLFWHTYGWASGRSTTWSSRAAGGGAGPAAPVRPLGLAAGADYRPVARPTMFSSRTIGGRSGVGKLRPSGFGVVSVRQSPSGRITAVGSGSGRSGSFGRYGGSSFG